MHELTERTTIECTTIWTYCANSYYSIKLQEIVLNVFASSKYDSSSLSTRNGEESFKREVGEWMNEWNIYLSLEHN